MSKAPPTPARRISGFCNRTLPRTRDYDPHQRCPGCDCDAPGCPCNPEGDEPVKNIQAEVTPPEPETPEVVVAQLAHDVAMLDTALAGYDPADWRDALRLLHQLRVALLRARKVDDVLVRWLYLHGEHGQHQTVDGIPGEFYIGRGRTKERWESEQGVRDYVDAKLMDADGELPDHETLISWVLEVLPATASTGLRRTPLKAVGLDPKRYVEDEPGALRVDLPRPG